MQSKQSSSGFGQSSNYKPGAKAVLSLFIMLSLIWFIASNSLISQQLILGLLLPVWLIKLLPVLIYIAFVVYLAYLLLLRGFQPLQELNQQLQQKTESLSRILEGSQLGYWDWHIESNEVKRNKLWAEMLGYQPEEIALTSQQWTELLHPDDRQAAWDSIKAVLKGESNEHQLIYRMRTKNGHYKWVLDNARVVERDSKGQPLRLAGTHHDIDKQKKPN